MPSGNVGFSSFGGTRRTDNTVHFDISRYIQGIVSGHVANDTLRMYAPFRTVFNSDFNTYLEMEKLAVKKSQQED